MPPKKRARQEKPAAKATLRKMPVTPDADFQRLPEATRKSLQNLLRIQKLGEDDTLLGSPFESTGDPVVTVLTKHVPATSPFAWLEPENLTAPACWKDPLRGPIEACCLLQKHVDILPLLRHTTSIAQTSNALVALEACLLSKIQRSSNGDTALQIADAKLVGETQDVILEVVSRYNDAIAVEALRVELEPLWVEATPQLKTIHSRGHRHLTTRYRLWQDRKLLNYLLHRKEYFVLPPFEVQGTDAQREVAKAVFDNLRKYGWSVLSGPGGAGKTYLLGQLASVLKSYQVPNDHLTALRCPLCNEPFPERCFSCNYMRPKHKDRAISVALTAPTNRAVAVLRRVVEDLGGNIICYTLHALAKASHAIPIDVLVVDEASMLASEHGDLILQTQALSHACMLLVGDEAQLPPVGGGELLRPLLQAAALPCLTVNMRAEAALSEPLQKVRNGEAGAMAAYAIACSTETARHDAVFAADEIGRSRVVLAPVNDDRVAYCRFAMSKLAPKQDSRDDYISKRPSPRIFVPFLGLPVRFQNNSLKPLACCGMLGEIIAVAEEKSAFYISIEVSTPDGLRIVELSGSLARLAYHLRPAYAVTVHDAQGGEFDSVDVLLPASLECPLYNRELLYTAVSRARRRVTLWSLNANFEAYVPKMSRRSSPRTTPLAVLLKAEMRHRTPADIIEEVDDV